MTQLRVGVLALQGDFAKHQAMLERLEVDAPQIRKPEELATLDGLIIPGGESTALLKLMAPLNWFQALKKFHADGKGLFGTCAGMILLATTVLPKQQSLAVIDCVIKRNAYGRQQDSHVAFGESNDNTLSITDCPLVFIRAPQVVSVMDNVKTLVTCHDQAVCLRQNNVLVSSFHPEMTRCDVFHRYFCNMLS